jgi:hypothetical protein
MRTSQEIEAISNAIEKCGFNFDIGLEEKLSDKEVAEILATLLFEVTNNSKNRLIEVRDYEQIAKKGTFRYSGKADTMFKEGLIPENVFQELKTLPENEKDTRHIGPSYLKVKGLLTHHGAREFFGRQMAYRILDHVKKVPLEKPDGFIVCSPNMTGGVYIGDETGAQLSLVSSEHNIWPATPYMRETRKTIDVISPKEKITDFWEGLIPTVEDTSLINCFEELRTAAETSQNATNIYRHFGYNEENNVRIAEGCVFDYQHPVGVERIKRLGVAGLYAVGGKTFFNVAANLGYINDSQLQTAKNWLNDPWKFTMKVTPLVKKLG